MKVSVIMASYLENYPGSSTNKEPKFVRAVKSFLNQTYEDKELIIVADGCQKTMKIYEQYFKDKENIKIIFLPKHPLYSGEIRNAGLRKASGNIIAYLDNDDLFGKEHLKTIVEQFTDDVDMVYYDDYMVMNKELTKFQIRHVLPRWASIGTSSIAHRNLPSLRGVWCSGYGHDFLTVIKMITNGISFKKLEKIPQYLVAHYSGVDF